MIMAGKVTEDPHSSVCCSSVSRQPLCHLFPLAPSPQQHNMALAAQTRSLRAAGRTTRAASRSAVKVFASSRVDR